MCSKQNLTYAYRQQTGGNKECNTLNSAAVPSQLLSSVSQLEYENGTIIESQVAELTQSGGYECNGEPSKITYEIICDKNGNASALPDAKQMTLNASNKCHPVITFTHNAGCAKYVAESSGWRHDPLEEVRILYATEYQLYLLQQAVNIVLGLYLCFLGGRRAKETIAIALGYGVFIITLAYTYNNTSLGDISYLIAIALGALMAYYAYYNLANLFVATLGALVGFLIALIIISILRIYNDIVVYLLIGVGIFIGFTGHFMTSKIELFMCILSGAYLIVQGVTGFLGGMPSFLTGIQDLLGGSQVYLTETVIYLVAWGVLAFVGYTYQKKH